jgi:hypothetical protein
MKECVLARADSSRACQLAKRAVDILISAIGGSSIYSDVPIQRIQRDIQAICLHALINPTTGLELYGGSCATSRPIVSTSSQPLLERAAQWATTSPDRAVVLGGSIAA